MLVNFRHNNCENEHYVNDHYNRHTYTNITSKIKTNYNGRSGLAHASSLICVCTNISLFLADTCCHYVGGLGARIVSSVNYYLRSRLV